MAAGIPGKCESCGAALPEDQLVRIAGKLVCGACKADAVLSLKSGVSMSANRVTPAEAEAIRKQIRNYNLLSFAFAVPGLILLAGGRGMTAPALASSSGDAAVGLVLAFAGVVLFMVGMCFYARMKGRHLALGLLGLMTCLGLLILNFVPKMCRRCKKSQSYRSKECGECGSPL